VDRGYATAHPCHHNRARLFHIHHKALYAAIGEPEFAMEHMRLEVHVCELRV
jgi:hypothetical protein